MPHVVTPPALIAGARVAAVLAVVHAANDVLMAFIGVLLPSRGGCSAHSRLLPARARSSTVRCVLLPVAAAASYRALPDRTVPPGHHDSERTDGGQ